MRTHDVPLEARIAPALSTLMLLAAVWIGSPTTFIVLIPFALVGAIWGRHPIDVVYSDLLAPIFDARPLAKCGASRRFASALAAVWLVIVAIAFRNGPTTTGGLLAGLMAATTFLTATLDFCLPCYVWGLARGLRSTSPVQLLSHDPTQRLPRSSEQRVRQAS
ncbi:MAG TPA: DUF4395 family protein [Thermoanaerobaculia bacterium]|jgi:hypothetical protein|nr:DUF4395 family protein [Thermoanaerobaculia bacterium]